MLPALLMLSCSQDDSSVAGNETMYFPDNNDGWAEKSVHSMGWNEDGIAPLLDYLQTKNTRSFIVLVDGKIVMENYFNGAMRGTPWYWSNADKTITAAVAGIAQQDGYLNIDNSVCSYLGNSWTSAPADKENLITCRHLLSMTSGLDAMAEYDLSPANLKYNCDAGTKWAYHNVDNKLRDIVTSVTNKNWENYFSDELAGPIGMTGNWVKLNGQDTYRSDARSMARFGLLALNKGKWRGEQIVDSDYFSTAVSSSQDINKSFGYLWWLNGKDSYYLPQSENAQSGSIITSAPQDMYMAMGNGDQRIYVVPSRHMVVIRMGESAETGTSAVNNFDEQLWVRMNDLIN